MRAEFIDPGLFRHELALEEAVLTPDGAGGHLADWQEVATVFARLEPVASRPMEAADQPLVFVTHRVTLRFRAEVKRGMRFARQGRSFEILTAHDPDETGRYLVCTAREAGR